MIQSHQHPVETTKEINQIVGKSALVAFLTVEQVMYIIWPVAVIWGFNLLFDADWRICLALTVFFFLTIFLLTLNGAHKFFEKLYFQTGYTLTFQSVKPGSVFMPETLKRTNQLTLLLRGLFNKKQQSDHQDPFEAESNLVVPVSIELDNQAVGCYLLKDKKGWHTVFALNSAGLDPAITNAEARIHNELADIGLRSLPPQTYITTDFASFCEDKDEQARLDTLLNQVSSPLEKELLHSQKGSVTAQRDQGRRQVKTLTLYLQHPVNQRRDQDFFDLILEWVYNLADKVSGSKSDSDLKRICSVITQSYNEGFIRFANLMEQNFSLEVAPLGIQEFIAKDYLELHQDATTVIIPQLIRLTPEGAKVEVLDHFTHTNTYLFKGEKGVSAVPVPKRQYLHFPARRKVGGCMQIGKTLAFSSPKGAEIGQVNFFSDLMQRAQQRDYRIVTQIGATNSYLQRFLLERQTRESTSFAKRANEGGHDIDVTAIEKIGDTVEARKDLYRGKLVVSVATAIWLYRDTPKELTHDFGVIQDVLGGTPAERCWERVRDFWAQSQPWHTTPLFFAPIKRVTHFKTDEAPGYMQLVKPRSLDDLGIHFLTRNGGSPLHIDLFETLNHLLIIATTRAGKSMILADIMMNFFFRRMPVVAFDFPKPTDGTSSFSDLIKILRRLGGSAAYYDTASESNNIIELPDLRGLHNADIRLSEILDFHRKAIQILVLGRIQDNDVVEACETLISDSYEAFHADPRIKQRYSAAIQGGFGSAAYANTPTLIDYLAFCEPWFIQYKERHAATLAKVDIETIGLILRQLRVKLRPGRLRRAIAEPSSFDPNVRFLVFALRGLDNDTEAAMWALSGYSALLRRAIASPDSAFIIDESPILFKFPAIANIVGQTCTNGLKWGCRVIITAQTASTIVQSSAGSKIMETVLTKIVGYISSEAIETLISLGFRGDILQNYCKKTHRPNLRRLTSSWLIRRGEDQIEAEYKASPLLVALVANNQNEQAARERIMALYPRDPLTGIAEFSTLLEHSMANKIPLEQIGTTLLPPKQKQAHLRAV